MIENPESSCWIPGSPALCFGAREWRSLDVRCDLIDFMEATS
jgi:hypothetical protein